MKLLFMCNSLVSGGAERLLSQIIPLIQKDGYNCTLLLLNNENGRYLDSIVTQGVAVEVIPKKYSSHFSKVKYIKKFIKLHNFDIVHANLFPTFYYLALAKALSKKGTFPSTCLTEHSTSNKRRKKRYLVCIERFVYSKYDLKICISEATKFNLIKWLNLKENDSSFLVINNGVDLNYIKNSKSLTKDYLGVPKESTLLCMVGSFTPDKNHKFALEVLSMLSSSFYLLLIGEGVLRDSISKLAIDLHIEKRVLFMGFQKNPYPFIKTCDIVLIPSIREGFGLVAAEAMACHKPIVCSNVDGLRDVVSNAGIKCELNVDQFVDAIIKMKINPSFYIENGIKQIHNFDIVATKNSYVNVFKQVCAKRNISKRK